MIIMNQIKDREKPKNIVTPINKEGQLIKKNSNSISKKSSLKKGTKQMAKTKNRIKKMNFQTQSREYEPLSDNDKYTIRLAGYRKQELRGRINDEDILRTPGRVVRSQHI